MLRLPGLQTSLYYGNLVNRDSPLNRGLVSWWLALPGGGKGNTLFDIASRNHGTLTNGPTWRGALGRPGGFGAIDFSPSISTRVNHPRLLEGCAAFTVAAWIRVKSGLGGSNSFWGEWDGGGGTVQQFSRYNSGMQWFVNNNANSANASITIPDASIPKNVWSHFCFVADGANLNAYLNGVSAATPVALAGPYIPSTSYANWAIGYGRSDSSLSQQDDHSYRSVGLSASQVVSLYRESLAGYPTTLNWSRPYPAFDQGGGGGATVLIPTLQIPRLAPIRSAFY